MKPKSVPMNHKFLPIFFAGICLATLASAQTLSINEASAPGGALVSSTNAGSFTTTFHDHDSLGKVTRGNTFMMPDTGDGNTSYRVSGLTLQKDAAQTYSTGDTLELWVFAWNPFTNGNTTTNWTAGDGMDPVNGGDNDPLDGTGATLLLAETFDLNGLSFTADQYFTFDFSNGPLTLSENTAYAFLIGYKDGDGLGGSDDNFRLKQASNNTSYAGGLQIRTQGSPSANSTFERDVAFYLSGTVIPGKFLEPAPPFQDGMILQRGKPIPVWGWATANAEVSVILNGTERTTTADSEGAWSLEMPTMTAGGPYTMTVTSGTESIELTDVLVGDVWITFGQSNMVRPLSEMDGAAAYIKDISGNDLPIRCLKVEQMVATSPSEKGNMIWLDNSDPGAWTSVGTVFAYQMYQATGVPTGIIWAAWGSSYIEGWMPVEMTDDFPHFAAIMDDYHANDEAQVASIIDTINRPWPQPWPIPPSSDEVFLRTRPNIIYNQMIHPLLPYGISGFVWYQGEANSNNAVDTAQYGFTLPKFAAEYCERFGQEDLQFLGVQLPSHNKTYWPWFRESQNQLTNLPNGHVAVTIDTGDPGDIHPNDKEPIGIRLSLLARKYSLGESIEAHGPIYDSLSINGSQVTVGFTHADGLTTDDTLAPTTFELAGVDQVFHAATSASISGTDVIVSSTSVPDPVAVRYAWSPAPVASVNLVNSSGLPAAPFRTDNWPMPGLAAQAPQSVNDAYSTPYKQLLTVPVAGVLANDMDLNHDPLTVSLVSDVSHGILDLSSDGSFTYTPDADFSGTDSFTYRVSDGALNSPDASVTITVGPSGYDQWKAGINWTPGGDDSKTGDPDKDGVDNFLEYALGMDPLVSDISGLPTLNQSGSDYSFDFNNVRTDVNYEVLLSTDLVDWSDPPFAVLTSEDSTPVLISVSDGDGDRLFVRLRVLESSAASSE